MRQIFLFLAFVGLLFLVLLMGLLTCWNVYWLFTSDWSNWKDIKESPATPLVGVVYGCWVFGYLFRGLVATGQKIVWIVR